MEHIHTNRHTYYTESILKPLPPSYATLLNTNHFLSSALLISHGFTFINLVLKRRSCDAFCVLEFTNKLFRGAGVSSCKCNSGVQLSSFLSFIFCLSVRRLDSLSLKAVKTQVRSKRICTPRPTRITAAHDCRRARLAHADTVLRTIRRVCGEPVQLVASLGTLSSVSEDSPVGASKAKLVFMEDTKKENRIERGVRALVQKYAPALFLVRRTSRWCSRRRRAAAVRCVSKHILEREQRLANRRFKTDRRRGGRDEGEPDQTRRMHPTSKARFGSPFVA